MKLPFTHPGIKYSTRVLFLTAAIGVILTPVISAQQIQAGAQGFQAVQDKVTKTPQQWKQQLTDLEYYVTREKGTERAFTGKYWDNKEAGVYTCKCCGKELFDSKTKFKSGTGWPSYFQPISPNAVTNIADYTGGMVRTEVVCSRCDSHLGHVFDDGPQPTGQRYCMNSVSLGFKRAGQAAAGGQVVGQLGQAVRQPPEGLPSAQQLLQSLSVAASENSKEKFLKCICTARLPENIRAGLKASTRPVVAKKVTSMRLIAKQGTAPVGYEFNVNHIGNVEATFEDGTSSSIWAYGEYGGQYYVAVPVPAGSMPKGSGSR